MNKLTFVMLAALAVGNMSVAIAADSNAYNTNKEQLRKAAQVEERRGYLRNQAYMANSWAIETTRRASVARLFRTPFQNQASYQALIAREKAHEINRDLAAFDRNNP